ncbi:MAG: M48 family metallopeptidase [Lachnospiraceae bacterium]|jgi:predicted metal-dependent hydrolase|nr:M48 family metallopeptidase [Lachnospiraceae bacterium]MDO4408189.1 SprT family zinc-dependent metalloprotease [Eubacteriales bacterium]
MNTINPRGNSSLNTSSSDPDLSAIRIIRSSRRTLSLQVKNDGQVIVRAPRHVTLQEIAAFVRKNSAWLHKHLEKVRKEKELNAASPVQPLTMDDIQKLADEALRVIPGRVAHFAPLVGVTYGRITVRNQRTRWGSCSSKGNLNFNCLLMLAPPDILDYVVVHELCHRKEMNHSPKFWAEVAKVIPDYKERQKWLRTEGSNIMRRMTG